MAEQEHIEAKAVSLHEEVVDLLRVRIREGTASSGDLAAAVQLIKHNKIADARPNAPVRDLAREVPFSSVDEEIT